MTGLFPPDLPPAGSRSRRRRLPADGGRGTSRPFRWAATWPPPALNWRWLGLALLVGVACRAPAQIPAADPLDKLDAATPTERVRIFLIAPGDGGQLGRKAGCGDSAVPVAVQLPRSEAALEGALSALLAMHSEHDEATGLANALYASDLKLAGIDRRGPEVRVRLNGYVELAGACDNSRLLAQLTETALQFPDISHVQFLVEGQPLRDLILASGSLPAPATTGPVPDAAPPAPPAAPRSSPAGL